MRGERGVGGDSRKQSCPQSITCNRFEPDWVVERAYLHDLHRGRLVDHLRLWLNNSGVGGGLLPSATVMLMMTVIRCQSGSDGCACGHAEHCEREYEYEYVEYEWKNGACRV